MTTDRAAGPGGTVQGAQVTARIALLLRLVGRAPAGALTVVVDNRDKGVNHNVHFASVKGSPATDLEEGPSTQQLELTLAAGTYAYVCDLHTNMTGTLTVSG